MRRSASRLPLWAFFSSFLVWAPLLAAPGLPEASRCSQARQALHGAWEADPRGSQLLFQEDQIVVRRDGALSVAAILERAPCELIVRYQGLRSTWKLDWADGLLVVHADEDLRLRPLASVPRELDISVPVLLQPKALEVAEVNAIAAELVARGAKDQDAAKDPGLRAGRPAILAENLRYLRDLTSRIGWIDIPRFGQPAASAAILIAKHGSDLQLMKAALPIVETDVKAHGGSGQMFSVLYDELQITLGHRQRFGTQFMPDAHGHPFILPLEEPARVDFYRKEIGILSFEEYLKLVRDNMGVAAIRVAGSDE